MKTYKSRKSVQAMRITQINVIAGPEGKMYSPSIYTYEDGRHDTVQSNDPKLQYCRPVVGDYLVRHENGREEFCPRLVFEDCYTIRAGAMVTAATAVETTPENLLAELEEAGATGWAYRVRELLNRKPNTAAVLKLDADFNPTDLDGFKKQWNEACKNGRPGGLTLSPAEPDISVRVRNHLASALPAKITREALEARIKSVTYEVRPDGRSTMCEITMENDWSERGWSASVSAAEFNKELGEKYAYEEALARQWANEGYLLRERRFGAGLV